MPPAMSKRSYPAQLMHGKARGNARAAAVIWDMHVYITQLIECEISFKCDFNLDFMFLLYYSASNIEQNKSKHDSQVSNTKKYGLYLMKSNLRRLLLAVWQIKTRLFKIGDIFWGNNNEATFKSVIGLRNGYENTKVVIVRVA